MRRAGEVAAHVRRGGLAGAHRPDLPVRGGPPAHPLPARTGGLAFAEIFVDTPLEECERRDPKGLYARARAGQLPGFTGIDSAYEVPSRPDLVLGPDAGSLPEQISLVLELLEELLASGPAQFAPAPPGAPDYSWTSSISVPNDVLGCTKATVVPREPGPRRLVDDPAAGVLDRLRAPRAQSSTR